MLVAIARRTASAAFNPEGAGCMKLEIFETPHAAEPWSKMTTDEPKKKRPLGLGAAGSSAKLAKQTAKEDAHVDGQEEEAGQSQTMFQLPEGELSEEAEIRTIFIAAEAAYNDFRALDEEELEENEAKPEEECMKNRALKLYAGVVHECDRLLKLHDAGEHAELTPEIFELMGDALFKLRCLESEDFDISVEDEYFLAAMEKYQAGQEEFPENIDILFSQARLDICRAILSSDDDIETTLSQVAVSFPKIPLESYQKNVHKLWSSLGEFSALLQDMPEALCAVCRICLDIAPEGATLSFDEQLQMASWQAKLIEATMALDTIEIEAVEAGLERLESLLGSAEPTQDTEAEATFGELKAQLQLLRGSKFGLQGNVEEEQKCYQAALEEFQGLQERLGIPIPEFIRELTTE